MCTVKPSVAPGQRAVTIASGDEGRQLLGGEAGGLSRALRRPRSFLLLCVLGDGRPFGFQSKVTSGRDVAET